MKARSFLESTPAALAKAIETWTEAEHVAPRAIGYATHQADDGRVLFSALVLHVPGETAAVPLDDLSAAWKADVLSSKGTQP